MKRKDTIQKSFTDATGKRHFIRAATEEEAIAKLAIKKDIVARGEIIVDPNTSVERWADNYWAVFVEPQTSKKHAEDIKRMLRKRVIPAIGRLKLSQVRPIHIQKIITGAEGMSYSYRYKLVLLVKNLFKTAAQNKLLLENPAEGLRFPKKAEEQIGRALTEAEKEIFEKFMPKHRFGPALALMLYAGLRTQEVMTLKWSDVFLNHDPPIIRISTALKSDGTIGQPKSIAGIRAVPIQNRLMPYLQKPHSTEFAPFVVRPEGQLKYTRQSWMAGWKNFIREVNIALGCRTFRNKLLPPYPLAEDLRPYYLRHTFCTDCCAAGVPIQEASRIMGHSSISITLRYYTHASREATISALEKLNRGQGVDTKP